MKKIAETIKNIWRIEDLRMRLLITILFIAIYRFGSFVVLPGIDPEKLTKLHEQTSTGLMSLLNMFSGGAFSNASIFALGIMPYISASIVMQLLAVAVPYFQKIQREGESGRRKINQYTRYGTVVVGAFQAFAYISLLTNQMRVVSPNINMVLFTIATVIILTAGTIFVMWLGEQIQERGLGNGTSLIIMANIISRLPASFWAEVKSRTTTGSGILFLVFEMVILAMVILGTIMLILSTTIVV